MAQQLIPSTPLKGMAQPPNSAVRARPHVATPDAGGTSRLGATTDIEEDRRVLADFASNGEARIGAPGQLAKPTASNQRDPDPEILAPEGP